MTHSMHQRCQFMMHVCLYTCTVDLLIALVTHVACFECIQQKLKFTENHGLESCWIPQPMDINPLLCPLVHPLLPEWRHNSPPSVFVVCVRNSTITDLNACFTRFHQFISAFSICMIVVHVSAICGVTANCMFHFWNKLLKAYCIICKIC